MTEELHISAQLDKLIETKYELTETMEKAQEAKDAWDGHEEEVQGGHVFENVAELSEYLVRREYLQGELERAENKRDTARERWGELTRWVVSTLPVGASVDYDYGGNDAELKGLYRITYDSPSSGPSDTVVSVEKLSA